MRRSGADDGIIGKGKKCNFVFFIRRNIYATESGSYTIYYNINIFYIYIMRPALRVHHIYILNTILAANSQRFAIISIYIYISMYMGHG